MKTKPLLAAEDKARVQDLQQPTNNGPTACHKYSSGKRKSNTSSYFQRDKYMQTSGTELSSSSFQVNLG